LDLRVFELVPEHSTLLVDERDVVGQAGADLHPDDLGCSRAITLTADLDDVTGHRRHRQCADQRRGEHRCQPSLSSHVALLVTGTTRSNASFLSIHRVSTNTATGENTASRCPTSGRAPPARWPGTG